MDDDKEEVILVDKDDRETGRAAKLTAHRLGLMHRAISVCVVDRQGRMLLQRRARGKYHSGGLWTNACCTHPRPGESVELAARRRLREELGVSCSLRWMLRTHYEAPVGGDLIENEVVHLFHGFHVGEVAPNRDEVDSFRWTPRRALFNDIQERPEEFTYWFRYYIQSFGDALFESPAAA